MVFLPREFGARIIQFIAASVVLALSIWIHWRFDRLLESCRDEGYICEPRRWPASTIFSAFVGGFGLFDVAVGVLFLWFEDPLFVQLGTDVLAAAFYLAGGVNLAVLYHSQDSIRARELEFAIGFQFIGFIGTAVCLLCGVLDCRTARKGRGRR